MNSTTLSLIIVKRSDFRNKAFPLDMEGMLQEARLKLKAASFMSDDDFFLVDVSTSIDMDLEDEIPLKNLIGKAGGKSEDDDTDENGERGKLLIGQPRLDVKDPERIPLKYFSRQLQQLVYNNASIFRGLVIGEDGWRKSLHDIYEFRHGYFPDINTPDKNTEYLSSFAFSKTMIETKELSSRSTKLELSAPFGSTSSEFSHQKEKTTTSSEITEYLLARLIVAHADIAIEADRLKVNKAFVTDVANAVSGLEYRNFYHLIEVLNTWGYYIPTRLLFGGSVNGREETKISEFSLAETESNEFSTSFKLDVKGFGAGVSSGNKNEKGTKTSNERKYVAINKDIRGGKPGLESELGDWIKSVQSPETWVVADVLEFWPTLELLRRDTDGGNQALGRALKLLDKYSATPEANKLVTYLDLRKYATRIEGMVNPFD